jgi:hypothetical protein
MITADVARKKVKQYTDIFNKYNVSEDEKHNFLHCIFTIEEKIKDAVRFGRTSTKVYSMFFFEDLKNTIAPKVISYISSLGYKIKYDSESSIETKLFGEGTYIKTDYFFDVCWNDFNGTCCPMQCPFKK